MLSFNHSAEFGRQSAAVAIECHWSTGIPQVTNAKSIPELEFDDDSCSTCQFNAKKQIVQPEPVKINRDSASSNVPVKSKFKFSVQIKLKIIRNQFL